MKTNTHAPSSTYSRLQPRLFAAAGATWLLLAATAGCLLAASAPTPSVAPDETPADAWSPQGQQLLAAIVALLVAMVLMERLCAWRLRARQRQVTAEPSLRKALPSNLPPYQSSGLTTSSDTLRPSPGFYSL